MRLFLSTALALTLVAPAAAQQQTRPLSPVERVYRMEQQAAANQAVTVAQANRITNLENQMIEVLRQIEGANNRIAALEAENGRLRADLNRRPASEPRPVAGPPAASSSSGSTAEAPATPKTGDVEADGEAAYDAGYQLWTQKKYTQSITALRAMASSFPGHRRVSWANNLIGRALLDSGQPRAAAEALLANYRGNPQGERAADSLYYLGQSLVALKQNAQACKAYAELEEVYGAKMRDELKRMLPLAKSRAGCS